MEPALYRQTFGKKEKLCSKSAIDKLFNEGSSFFISPIKVLMLCSPSQVDEPVKVLITVPKKYLRNAVDRNRIKRLIRESYRKHKSLLANWKKADTEVALAFIYTSKKLISYKETESTIERILQRILQQELPIRKPGL